MNATKESNNLINERGKGKDRKIRHGEIIKVSKRQKKYN
jgi:hypothetical protein